MSLNPFFTPTSVAVVGASANPAKLGHIVLRNIRDGGYGGKLYAINPSAEPVLDLPTYPKIGRVPGSVELAVLAVPAAAAAAVAAECGQAGIKAIIVIAAGFQEVGAVGAAREAKLKQVTKRYGMRLLGPNCLGVIDPVNCLNASFAGGLPKRGDIAVASQSGAMCTAILDWAKQVDLGFSSFVSVGNMADVTESDLLERWAGEATTGTVLAYLEGIPDGRRFLQSAARLTRRKPFVLIKAGVSEAGTAAVSSHTGSLTGADEVLSQALVETGVTRAHSITELFDYSLAFARAPLPKGDRVAIVTNAGGPGVLATDAVAAAGLTMAGLGPGTRRRLAETLPPEASVHNPIDCIGDARADRYRVALAAPLADRGVDAVLVLLTPQAMTEISATAEVIAEAAAVTTKTVVACFIGGQAVAPGLKYLQETGVAAYPAPERAVAALAALRRYAAYRAEKPAPRRVAAEPQRGSVKVLRAARRRRQRALWGAEAAAFLKPYGIETPRAVVATSARQAAAAAEEVGYPVVLKIDSPDILHKTDAGGVRLDLDSAEAVRDAYREMLETIRRSHPRARLRGASVQRMLGEGHDFLIGGKRDPAFGPVVVFGYGGIFVEVMRDLAIGLAPLNDAGAEALIDRTKSAALLGGARGLKPSDRQTLVKAVVGVSRVMVDFPEISELDLNPIRVFKKGALALDIRIITT